MIFPSLHKETNSSSAWAELFRGSRFHPREKTASQKLCFSPVTEKPRNFAVGGYDIHSQARIEHLCFGCSLGYRFVQCAFYSACVFAGPKPLLLSVMKGIIVCNLQWRCEPPIVDPDGFAVTAKDAFAKAYNAELRCTAGSLSEGTGLIADAWRTQTSIHPIW